MLPPRSQCSCSMLLLPLLLASCIGGAIAQFTVQSGPCTTSQGGRCVRRGSYRNNEECRITVGRRSTVFATRFDTESGYDFLTVAGTRYSGRTGPSGVEVESAITWDTDFSSPRSGWEICMCASGTYFSSGSCTACGAGRYSSSTGATSSSSCIACGAGRYSSSGSSACPACLAGFYHPTAAAAGNTDPCIACDDGWYGTATGETTPVSACPYNACPPGTFSSASSGACAACAPGSFTADSAADADGEGARTGASHCNACPAGLFNGEGDSTCDVCVPGHFTSSSAGDPPAQTGASHCNRCAAGRFNAESDATCDGECPAGKFGTVTGSTNVDSCSDCDPGMYQPLTA